MKLLPGGYIDLRAALARTGKILLSDLWDAATPEDRHFLTVAELPLGFAAINASRGGSLAQAIYAKLRPALADGALPSFLRMQTGPAKRIAPGSWAAGATDRLIAVVDGKASFDVGEDPAAVGTVIINSSDLEAFLGGDTTLRRDNAFINPAPDPRPQGARRGRPPKPDADRFWVEVCCRIHEGRQHEPLAGFVKEMADWCQTKMTNPYDQETVRKKLGHLVREMKRESRD